MNKMEVAKITPSGVKTTEKRWCASHFGEVPIDAGSYVQCKKTKRWICDRCQKKRLLRKTEIQTVRPG